MKLNWNWIERDEQPKIVDAVRAHETLYTCKSATAVNLKQIKKMEQKQNE